MKLLLFFIFLSTSQGIAQEFSKAIEDNSFFIEEAYNQEDHVVQHIFNIVRSQTSRSFENSFTQEWPAWGQSHQLSFTLPLHIDHTVGPFSSGVGDILINYRYQIIDIPGLAIAPRFSLILPTGDEKKGFGNGVVGVQLNIPISKRFSNEFVTHYNAGATVYPDAKFWFSNHTSTISEYFFGVSGIYLMNKHFNVITEVLYTSSGSRFGRTNELIVSPGVRWAIDIEELQVVPGIAFPLYFNSVEQENGILFYLSFEHPY